MERRHADVIHSGDLPTDLVPAALGLVNLPADRS
jgi:hypothetical protein